MSEDKMELAVPKDTLDSLTQGSILKVMPKERIEALKKAIGPRYAKKMNDAKLELFVAIATKYDLDPFIKEIFYSEQKGAVVPITGRDGFLKIAKRDEGYAGIESFAVCENDIFEMNAGTGEIKHIIKNGDRGEVIGGWARAYHTTRKPIVSYENISEYMKSDSDAWKKYKSAMIRKVVESIVLRRQYSISGIVGMEEVSAVKEGDNFITVQIPKDDLSQGVKVEEPNTVDADFTVKETTEYQCEDKTTPEEKEKVLEQIEEDNKKEDEEIKRVAAEIQKDLKLQKRMEKRKKPEKEVKVVSRKTKDIIDETIASLNSDEIVDPDEVEDKPLKLGDEPPKAEIDIDDVEGMEEGNKVLDNISSTIADKRAKKKNFEPVTMDDQEKELMKWRKAGKVSVKEYMQAKIVLDYLRKD